jgi:chemotaxis protein methyltransferase WspC
LLDRIDKLLAPEGVLLIGHADRLDPGGGATRFVATGEPGCFAYRRITSRGTCAASSFQSLESEAPGLSLIAPAPINAIKAGHPEEPVRALEHPSSIAPEKLVPTEPQPSLLMGEASELANRGRFIEAIGLCERFLRDNGLSAPAYFLMGMISQAAGERDRAEECFRKTVYLDPNHDEALLALALLAEGRGDKNAAAGFRLRAERTESLSRNRVN